MRDITKLSGYPRRNVKTRLERYIKITIDSESLSWYIHLCLLNNSDSVFSLLGHIFEHYGTKNADRIWFDCRKSIMMNELQNSKLL